MDNNFSTKWRPTTYADVVGQEIPKAVLKKIALSPGIACRSIFLKGSYGSGKTTLARIFAASMNCSEFPKTGDVCHDCEGCQETSVQNSQVYMEFDATTAGNIDNIKALHDKLTYLPPKGMRRVVVLDEVHACSNAALNALLKMVEEGIPSTIFVFCSTEDILPTLKSRSICLDITTIPKALMSERVKFVAQQEGVSIDDLMVDIICEKSLGHMRDALSLLQLYSLAGENAIKTPIGLIQSFIFSVIKKDKLTALSLIPEILKFPTTDVSVAISTFLLNVLRSTPESKLHILVTKGIINKLFGYFYSSTARQAVKTEAGMELLLRAFAERANNG